MIESIHGLECLTQLDVLSLRKQQNSSSFIASIFAHKLPVRSLYLSSNHINSLEFPHVYHDIQYLEIASCGLAELPSDFGLRFPNLRTLNLNSNALKDPRQLLNIQHLEELHLAGNRITRLRKCIAALAKMTCLRVLDVRNNPISLGLYAAMATASTEIQLVAGKRTIESTTDGLEHLQRRRRAAHTLPPADGSADSDYAARLDEETKQRRRVHELMLANNCKKLDSLDGLAFDRKAIMVKDSVWDRLVELDVVKPSGSKIDVHIVEGTLAESM